MKWWDRSWNPFSGCTRCSEGCANCIAFENLKRQGRTSDPRFNSNVAENNLYENLNYVVCSLGDIFHEDNYFQDIDKVFFNMIRYPRNRYFVLTKRSREMKEYFTDSQLPEEIRNYDWDSLWTGVTVESNQHLNRIDDLLATPVVKHRFLALEPLLERVSISRYLRTGKIEWVIVGTEIGENRRPANSEWVRQIVTECRECGVPVFVSQLEIENEVVQDVSKFPTSLQIRETPWESFQTEFRDYETYNVLDCECIVGLRLVKQDDGKEYFDFLLQSPQFVYQSLKERAYIQDAELLTPIRYLSPKGTLSTKKLIQETREFVTRQYFQLKTKNAPEKWLRMILPQDVLVKFHWLIPKDSINTVMDSFNIETEKITEIKQYFITMKILILKWRTQNASS